VVLNDCTTCFYLKKKGSHDIHYIMIIGVHSKDFEKNYFLGIFPPNNGETNAKFN
jgi:hypothetical protein